MSDHTGVDEEGTVDRVCHDEQMTIWTGEIVDSLSMGGYFRERLSYDDGLHIHAAIARDLRSIIGSAFLQAEAPVNNTMSTLTAHPGSDGAVPEISDLKAENERLRAERDEARTEVTDMMWQRRRAEERAEAAEAALAESERKRVEDVEALEPFLVRAPVLVDICTMKTSAGVDYYVRFRCSGREVTPHMFKERYKAEYTADHYAWVFGLRPDEPDLMAYDPESHPDAPAPTQETPHVES